MSPGLPLTTPEAALAACLARHGAPGGENPLGVAVSGGSDSMALLHLLAGQGARLSVATVDHGLRPEAADEAALVAAACKGLGLPHTTLRWCDDGGRGNLSARAREARYGLLRDWAAAQGIDTVALGHTLDDQAETVLMRLARGSGVDGLCGMAEARHGRGILWLRPLLSVRRAGLRDWLLARGLGWIDDPTNDDPAYDRVKARRALGLLEPLGISRDGLAETALWMARAREVLGAAAAGLAKAAVRHEAAEIVIDAAAYRTAPEETRLRLLSAAVCWIGGTAYRPRLLALRQVEAAVLDGRARTLAGCLLTHRRGWLRVGREAKAVAGLTQAPDRVWDRRWRLAGPPAPAGSRLGPMGEAGIALCPGWRATGLPRQSLIAAPALWQGTTLLAAPLAGEPAGWRLEPARSPADFTRTLIAH